MGQLVIKYSRDGSHIDKAREAEADLRQMFFNAGMVNDLVRVYDKDYNIVFKSKKLSSEVMRKRVKNPSVPRLNPESTASSMYERFHGFPSTETLEVTEAIHEHRDLATLGKLCELKVRLITKKDMTISWDYDSPGQPTLASNERGTQLFIVGGDQAVSLARLGMGDKKWAKEHVVLGVLYELTYQTRKQFHRRQLIDYYHALGEETGVQPMLNYDTVNKKLSIVGGQYEIKPEGICN